MRGPGACLWLVDRRRGGWEEGGAHASRYYVTPDENLRATACVVRGSARGDVQTLC